MIRNRRRRSLSHSSLQNIKGNENFSLMVLQCGTAYKKYFSTCSITAKTDIHVEKNLKIGYILIHKLLLLILGLILDFVNTPEALLHSGPHVLRFVSEHRHNFRSDISKVEILCPFLLMYQLTN